MSCWEVELELVIVHFLGSENAAGPPWYVSDLRIRYNIPLGY